MKRFVFTLLPAVSLLLCAVLTTVWAVSSARGGFLQLLQVRSVGLYCEHHSLELLRRGDVVVVPWTSLRAPRLPGVAWDLHAQFAGFEIGRGSYVSCGGGVISMPQDVVRAPLWFLIGLFGVLPARWLCNRRRPGLGSCARCGYDLRATPARCPECGAVPLSRAAPTPTVFDRSVA